jgi:hypothetical protein
LGWLCPAVCTVSPSLRVSVLRSSCITASGSLLQLVLRHREWSLEAKPAGRRYPC